MLPRFVNVHAFTDYRSFLAEYMREREKKDKTYTQAYVCRKLGLPNSRSFIGDVIRGFKPLTASKTEALIGVLELDVSDANYFRTLVLYNQSGIPAEKAFHLEQLVSMNRSPTLLLDKKAFAYYSEWYHSTIRALLDIVDVKEDPSPLARTIFPRITLKKIKSSIELLKSLGLIRKNENGYWKPSESVIHSGPYLQEEIVKKYQVACLEIAKTAVFGDPSIPRNISTETLSVSKKGYALIEEKLQRFKSEIRAIVNRDEDKADKVYQMNIQLFPQST